MASFNIVFIIWLYLIVLIHAVPVKDDFSTDFAKQIIRISKSADIKAFLNPAADPCTDFYNYSCGNWARSNPAQLLRYFTTDQFQMIARSFDRRLETMLNEPLTADSELLDAKLKKFYQSCQSVKNTDITYQLALENVYNEYRKMPFSVDDSVNETNFNWWEVIANIQNKYGLQIILAVDIMGDIRNNTNNRVYIGPPDYESNTKVLSLLTEISIAEQLIKYLSVENAKAKQIAKEIVEFEHALMQGGTGAHSDLGLDELLILKSINDLQKSYMEHIDMRRYLELVLGTDIPEGIYVNNLQYLDSLFETIAHKPKRIVANYIMFQLLQSYLIEAHDDSPSNWCIDKTKKYFGKYVDYSIYQRYKSDELERDVLQVWEDIRASFRDELRGDKLDWIKNATREYALEKLDNMDLQINSYENENFTEEYQNLDINERNYAFNIQELLKLEGRRKLQRLKEPATTIIDTEVLSFTPAYNILQNNIRIPVAMLQPRYFWDANYPEAVKYATLGYLIAHEMIHGFDDDGRNYDKYGNYHLWWDLKSTYEFEERRKCFQAQYHSYVYGGRKLPESISQSENIADNAGIKLAYAAYMRWLRAHTTSTSTTSAESINEKEQLPDLHLNNRQLFFVAFAQVWCDDVQTFFKSTMASADTHAPSMYRVIGSLSNFQEFSWVFECKQDSRMDPDFKCAIY